MIKKMLSFLLCGCALLGGLAASGCSDAPSEQKPSEEAVVFPSMKLNSERKLKVFGQDETLTYAQQIAAVCIQGLYAQKESVYYFSEGSHNTRFWLQEYRDNYGIEAEYVTFDEMLEAYKEDFDDPGFILYSYDADSLTDFSVDVATVICSVTGWIPVEAGSAHIALQAGLELKRDVREITEYTLEDCFEEFKDRLNNEAFFQLKSSIAPSRDFAVANKYFVYYTNANDISALNFRRTLHEWVKDDSPVYGWGPIDEHSHVLMSTQNGQFTIASDWSYNLTVHACAETFGAEPFARGGRAETTAEAGKHYVCLMESDGDNIQALHNTLVPSVKYMNAEKGDFPMTWTVSPSCAALQPAVLRYAYEHGGSDGFIAACSGTGFIYADKYPDLASYCGKLGEWFARADLAVTEIMTMTTETDELLRVAEEYAKIETLEGGVFKYGRNYPELAGSVYWANDKPFLSVKETLTSSNVSLLAEKINALPKNPLDIEGYTLLNVTPWTSSYADAVKFVGLLSDDVKVISVEQMVEMVAAYVPHETKTFTYGTF